MQTPPGCEFGLELLLVLPHLYALRAQTTCSHLGTRCLYYWSTTHTEVCLPRRFRRLPAEYPLRSLHGPIVAPPIPDWIPPPFATVYGAAGRHLLTAAGFRDRPVAVVHNKKCDEWGRGPVHYIPPVVLRQLFQRIEACGYLGVYVRPVGTEEGYVTDDNVIDTVSDDHRAVAECGGVCLQDLLGSQDFNTCQLLVSACCKRFVSVQGGAAILASYFGGRNLVYAREGVEVRRGLYLPGGIVSALSNCDIRVASSLDRLCREISSLLT